MERIISQKVKFHYGEEEEAFERDFDDSTWEEVTLPHDFAVSMPFSKEFSSGTGYLPGGIGWYRIHEKLEEKLSGKEIQIHFDGVYKHCKIWCNGYYLGRWANGYTAFSKDITHAVKFGDEENVIVVRVEHNDIADSRWYTGSGINKTVSLIISERCHVVRDENVVQILNKDVANGAKLYFKTAVQNDEDREVSAAITHTLYGRDGKTKVLELDSGETRLLPGEKKYVEQEGMLIAPGLWSDENPYLYTWETEVSYEKNQNKITDVIKSKIGIRDFSFDPDKGFFVNGRMTKLKGVCVHEDAGSFGSAVPKSVWQRRLEILKKMGANTIRMSHNPHSRELYDLCDEMGFYVIDEIFDEWEGVKNKWAKGHNVYPPKHQGYYEDFHEWHEKDVSSFVRENRNRACVIMWSIGNEIDYPNDPYCHESFATMTGNNDANKPESERKYNNNKPNSERLSVIAKELSKLVRAEDTTRPVTLASAFPELSSNIGLFDSIDVIGYNYKEHLYAQDHLRFPDKPIFGSENGQGLNEWLYVRDNDYISGQCLWTGIDFIGETVGWPKHGSEAGILTTAGFKKPEYYFRQAMWTDKPMVMIATGLSPADDRYDNRVIAWNYGEGEDVYADIFTNCDEAELFVNGRSLGRNKCEYVCSFKLPFEERALRAVGYKNGEEVCEYVLETTSEAVAIKTKPYIIGGEYKEYLDTTEYDSTRKSIGDVLQVEVTMVDIKGRTVHSADNLLNISCLEGAEILGIDNGNLGDTTPYTEMYRRTYHGKLIIYADKNKTGRIRIESEGMKPVEFELKAKE